MSAPSPVTGVARLPVQAREAPPKALPRDPVDDAFERLAAASALVGVDRDVLAVLRRPLESVGASIALRRDDGSLQVLDAWRCRWNDALGPTKGGIRFHPESNLREVLSLAFWMTCKCAVAGLPYGGAKGAVAVDARGWSAGELERLSRAYMRAFAPYVGADRDIPAPDMYTDARVMGWMADEYARCVGRFEPGVVTGKPVVLGGSLGRDTATGDGAFVVLRELLPRLGIALEGARVVVIGFGNAGQRIAKLLHVAGARIVGLADSRGAVRSDDGIRPEAVRAIRRFGASVGDYHGPGARSCDLDELLALPCDVLVPAATSGQIHAANAAGVRARCILEVANGPVLAGADPILRDAGVVAIPDILVNAGGVVVSYFEWLQNRSRDAWTAEAVRTRLDATMSAATARVCAAADAHRCDLRTGAYVVALERLSDAIRARL